MNRILYKKYLVVLISTIFSVLPLSAQTELTTEMVWQEGMHWCYPCYAAPDKFADDPGGYFLMEYKLEKKYHEESNETIFSIACRTNRFGKWTQWDDDYRYIKVEGNKVYGILDRTMIGEEGLTKFLMYDFDTWYEGETIRFEYFGAFSLETDSVVVEKMQRIVTDPDGKYYSYVLVGEDDAKLPYTYIKNIGRVQDRGIPNFIYYFFSIPVLIMKYGEPGGIMALQIWHPDLGVLYQHPDYEHVMELAGVDSLTADEAGEAVITARAGEVTVESAHPVDVMICTTTGVTVRRARVTGSATYPLAPGIYIVRAGSRTCKVCI